MIVSPGEKVPFTLGQVAVFLAVARTGGPTSAAQALNISQPAVSKSVSGLEQVSSSYSTFCLAQCLAQRQCCTDAGPACMTPLQLEHL